MLKIISVLSLLLIIFSCSSYNKEAEKSAKAKAASSRINDTQNNSSDIFKELGN
ncbi:MAG: hypothetical protein ISQ34_01480 [Rickettsiales bacterium]|nr:hypothetical protein [Rickettsiales bacterium]